MINASHSLQGDNSDITACGFRHIRVLPSTGGLTSARWNLFWGVGVGGGGLSDGGVVLDLLVSSDLLLRESTEYEDAMLAI